MGWELAQRITLPSTNAAAAGNQGSQAIDIDGNSMIISKYGAGATTAQNQQVYWYQRKNDGTWELEHTATGEDVGGATGDGFGIGVAICGNDALVGEYQQTTTGTGRVHFYHRGNDGEWELKKTTAPTDLTASNQFGITVDLSKNYAIVGANLHSTGAGATARGAVYIYKRGNDGDWVIHQKINGDEGGDQIGGVASRIYDNYALFMNGDGGAGVFYYYVKDNEGNFERASKTTYNSNANATAAAAGGIGLYGNNILASSGGNGADANLQTVAFYRRGNDGELTSLADFGDTDATTLFGRKCALYGNFAVSSNGIGANRSLAFYRRGNDGNWVREDDATTTNDDLGDFDGLAMSGNYVVVTAPDTANATARGQVFFYERKY